jgi:hypothetical protein
VRNRSRTQALVAAVAVVVGIAVDFSPGLSADGKVNVWVAVGTVALAFITWLSLSQTRDVLAAEDRRHQQGFAPLLVLERLRVDGDRVHADVRNQGLGLAIRVAVTIDGHLTSTLLVNAPPAGALQPLPMVGISGATRTHEISVVAKACAAGLWFAVPATYDGVELNRVRIEYADMFGNGYATTYGAFSSNVNEMTWTPPDHLAVKRGM